MALFSVKLLWAPRLATFLGDPADHTFTFGVFATGAFALSAAGSALAPRLAARAGATGRATALAFAGHGTTVLLLAAATHEAPFGAAFGASYLALGLAGPLQRQLLHERAPHAARTTTLSIDSLCLMGGGLVGALALSRLADAAGSPAAWVVAGLALAAASLLFLGLREDRAPEP
jgi:hypothetical protein